MSRILIVGATVLAFAGLGWLVLSRGFGTTSSILPNQDDTPSIVPQAATAAKFETWSKPAAALILTGEQLGYLEPCGCSEKQSGGIARRSDLLNQLESRGWAVAGLDLGGTIKRSRKQSEIKFLAVRSALEKLKYRGMGLGPEELKLQPGFLLSQGLSGGRPVPYLGTNLTFFDSPDLEGGPQSLQIFDVGGVKVGAAMVLGFSLQRDLFPEGGSTDVQFGAPADLLPGAIKKMEEAGAQVKVLLSFSDTAESTQLAKTFPQFDLVLSAGGPEDPHGAPEKVGKTLLAHVGQKGKYAGVLAFYPKENDKFKFDLVDLNRDRFKHDPAMDVVMAEYQQNLKDNLVDVFADLPEGFPPREGTYIGAARCGECHKKAFAKWQTTRHALAYQSLAEGRKDFEGTWTSRQHDPECLACHVTGWNAQEVYPYLSGFLPAEIASTKGSPERFELLKGQQCENCHGPGNRHAEVFTAWMKDPASVPAEQIAAANKAVKIELAAAEQSCIRCHDHENSPHFDFKTYWQKVSHPGRD